MIDKDRYQLWSKMGLVFLLTIIMFFATGCNATSERDFSAVRPLPTPIAAELPDEVKKVRDVALTHIDRQYDINLPMSDADWTVEYDILVDIIGAGAYRLTADTCVVTISNPVMGFDTAIYHVVLDDPAAGFHWEGDVDCQGQVLPSWSSAIDESSADMDTINLVEVAGLRRTVGIEVCSLDCASYTPFYTIANPEFVAALIDALDTEMPLRPHARCPAIYQLRFILANGQHYDFEYACQMMTPTYLRGGQDFWNGQDAVAPDAFNKLIMPLIGPSHVESAGKA